MIVEFAVGCLPLLHARVGLPLLRLGQSKKNGLPLGDTDMLSWNKLPMDVQSRFLALGRLKSLKDGVGYGLDEDGFGSRNAKEYGHVYHSKNRFLRDLVFSAHFRSLVHFVFCSNEAQFVLCKLPTAAPETPDTQSCVCQILFS